MDHRRKIKAILKEGIVILDGAVGTELQKKGMPAGVCPEDWCLSHPHVLGEIHSAYSRAGSRMVYTATFGANRFKLGQYGLTEVKKINRKLAEIARQAVGKGILIAGDIGPTGQFIEPFGPLSFEEAVAAFKEQALGLIAGGVDLFVIETMIDIQEARAALIAIKELGPYFTIASVTLEDNGRTLNGTDALSALITLQSLGADVVGCNCSAGPETMVGFIETMRPYARVPLAAKPNAGIPRLVDDRTVFPMGPEEFASFAPRFAAAGANLLGGCCGTTPEHIAKLAAAAQGLRPASPARKAISAVSSARESRIFSKNKPVLIIGERINPTGKRELQEELASGRTGLAVKLAREQEQAGADLLDVNVGMPGIDEAKTMREVVSSLALATRLPLVIDSGNAAAVEAALRIYPGRALLNSISDEDEKIEKILPLAAFYGAMIVILPLTGAEIPRKAEERKAVVRKIYSRLRKWGYTKEDVVVDALVLTAASSADLAPEALELVAWCEEEFRCPSLMGLTNISFGLPGRSWLNAAYLAMGQSRGLTLAIANPASSELMQIKRAADLLTGRDPQAKNYINNFRDSAQHHVFKDNLSLRDKIYKAVLEGDREIGSLVDAALVSGETAAGLVDEVLMKAIARVGELFEEKLYFLPQLIASAEAMKAAMERIEEEWHKEAVSSAGKGTIVLATVRGDIHDIGKNIVALILRNHGYQVVDLGKDVPAEVIIEAIKRHQPLVVGLSALMTTTMVQMREVINLARAAGLTCPFILGGAAVTDAYARSLGALYARDGVEAVRVIGDLS